MLPINYTKATPQERRAARLQYAKDQGGKCAHCGSDLEGPPVGRAAKDKINKALFPKSMFDWPVHLHHCHKTGMTIGAIHARCNAWLWQYRGE
jgi:ribosomal protein L34E